MQNSYTCKLAGIINYFMLALHSVVVVELIVYGKYTKHCNILAYFGRWILVSYKKTTL